MLKNINYGTTTAGGNIHIGDNIYVVERDFPHCILFLCIEKAELDYQAMLSVKGPDETALPLLHQQVSLPVGSGLFDQMNAFQEYRRGAGEVLRLTSDFGYSEQGLEASLPTAIYQSFLRGEIGDTCTFFLGLLQAGKIRDLLLVVSSEEEVIQNLPWEMTLPLLTAGGGNTLPRDNFGLIRSREKTVQDFNRQGPAAESAPIKLLFVPALPDNLSERSKMLELESEQKKIIDAVRRLEATGNERPKLVMEILDCANLEEIKAALTARSHDIVHISGHGQFVDTNKQGVLIMENEEGDQQTVTGYELGLALRAFSSIKLLVLSACETAVGSSEGSTAEQVAAAGVPAVLAMRFSVTDAGARLLTEKLYERLAYGDALTKAMHDARLELWQDVQQRRANAPQLDSSAEWFTPVLYQNQVIGPLIKPDQYHLDTLNRFYPKPDFLSSKHTRLIGEGFIGRKRLLIQLRHLLRQGQHVCLHGLGGLGKTTTAEAFAHHYRQRYGYEMLVFSRGVNIQEAVILEKIFNRWKSRVKPEEDVAAELKALLDSPDTDIEQKLQLVLDNCLAGRQTILILDNFEDVQTAADGTQQQEIVSDTLRNFIRYLLQNSPSNCHILLTSRYAITGLKGLVTHLELDKLSYAEQYRYMNFSPTLRKIPLAERELLHRRLDGHPRALQFLEGLLTKAPDTDLSTLIEKAEGQLFEDLLLERIYERLTIEEREVFAVASVFFNRSELAALSAVVPVEPVALVPVLTALRGWSLCFWNEATQVFEVHALTREWIRRQEKSELNRFKKVSHQIATHYWERLTLEGDLQAIDYFKQAEDWEGYANAAFELVSHYQTIGLYAIVRDLNLKVLQKNISPPINARAQNGLGLFYLALGQYEQALTYFEKSLAIVQQIGDRSSEGTAFNNIGTIYSNQGQYEQALTYYKQSLAIVKQIGGRSNEGSTLNNIGTIYSKQGQYEQALTYFEQSLAIVKQIGDRSSEGSTLNNIGNIYSNQGQYKQALTYFEQSLAIVQQIGDRSSEGSMLNNIGKIYSNQGQYEQTLIYYKQSLAIAQQIGDREGEGIRLNNIGSIYSSLGQYEQALTYCKQSLAIAQQIGDRHTEGLALVNIGDIYSNQGQYKQALTYFEQSLAITQQIGDRSTEGTVVNCIGNIYSNQGQYKQALTYFEQSLAIAQQIGERNNEGIRLNNIGTIYSNQGQYEQALTYFEQSLAIVKQIGDHTYEGTVLSSIGDIYSNQGKYEQALTYLKQSRAIAQQIGNRIDEAKVVTYLGFIYLSHYQNFEMAIPLFKQAYNLFAEMDSPDTNVPEGYLNAILEQIGEERFLRIIQTYQTNSHS